MTDQKFGAGAECFQAVECCFKLASVVPEHAVSSPVYGSEREYPCRLGIDLEIYRHGLGERRGQLHQAMLRLTSHVQTLMARSRRQRLRDAPGEGRQDTAEGGRSRNSWDLLNTNFRHESGRMLATPSMRVARHVARPESRWVLT